MMKLTASLAAAAILAALPAAAQQAGTNSGDIGAFADGSAFKYQDGKSLFESSCQGCHQPGGVGAVGAGHYPALAGNPNLESPGYPILLILHGQKAMPALGRILRRRPGGGDRELYPQQLRKHLAGRRGHRPGCRRPALTPRKETVP